MNPEDSSLFVQSLATGLSVLDAFTTDRPSMNLREIAEAASVTKSAAQRFTHTLVTLGLLRKDATSKRFSLSARTLNTGYRYLQTHVLLERANPYLLELNRQTGETVNLAELDSGEMVYIGRFPSPHRAVVHMPVGRRLPIFCSSAGRAFLSCLPDEQVEHILTSSERPNFTPHTITDINTLMGTIARVRETGFAYSIEEFYLSDLAFAVPVYNIRGEPVAAVNLSVSTAYWSFERAVAELVPKLIHTARLISTKPPTSRAMEPFQIGYGKVRDKLRHS
ncbi:IclR family transcriptional regulator [Pseudomonas sp. YY-1]|uniref:IclR family transcriptional regulator n=1 Tax=Pseudomonas sp. YY-1 TaxID=2058659 RepID=UPI000CB658DF|nr:IclR family transcriptional regulator [Pseudomonas sp. YY-1]PKQ39250.1 IclR family transcriptional regulator [Pseudomonas sp. YY-1]